MKRKLFHSSACFWALPLAAFCLVLVLPSAGLAQTASDYKTAGPEISFEPEPGPNQDSEPQRVRTVLELEIGTVGQENRPRPISIPVIDGPPDSALRQDLNRDDLPIPFSFSIGILDRETKVAEIHFYRTDDGPDQAWVPFQEALLDAEVETQVELDRNLTLSLRWVELREETIESVDGELVYRPIR